MDSVSMQLITKSLDGLHMRYIAIAQNVANAGSQGYRPISVEFEAELAAAFRKGGAELADFRPHYQSGPQLASNESQRVDIELARASQTAMRYSALIDMLGRQMSMARTLARGGQ